MNAITNYSVYTSEMAKSLYDKAFFIDKLQTDDPVIVDYGSGDGRLGRFIGAILEKSHYIAYDTDPSMLWLASEMLSSTDERAAFVNDWEKVKNWLDTSRNRERVVVANSVMHEIYNYGQNPTQFWEHLFCSDFDVIAIRDMVAPTYRAKATGSRTTDITKWTRSDERLLKSIREKYDPVRLADFEARWGSISYEMSMVHFLMKYRFVDNWSREVKEDYFPLNTSQFNELTSAWAKKHGYRLYHYENYCLKFNSDVIERDFGFPFDVDTHVKAIFKRDTTASA